MKDHLVISVQGSYFFFFYILAFFVALVIMLFDGYKKNFPKLKWTFFLCVTSFFFILGSKIVTYSPEEWRMLLSGFSLPPTHDKSLLGGLLLGVIGIFGASYLFRLKDNFLDTFAIVLPLAIAIQKIGCFLAGCCHGTVTSAPWAVKYQVNTLPHFHHFESGLISDHDILSLPVHPVQLYETILSLIIFGVIIKFRNSFKRNGSLLLLSFILLLLTRFNLEFLRDPLAHTIGGSMYWIFNTTQLVILPIFLILIWILKIRESSKNQTVIFEMQPDLGLVSSISLLFVSSSILWMLRSWLSISEIFVLGMHLFAVVSLVGYRLVGNYYASQYKWLYLSSLIFPIILMSQTLPEKGTDSVLANTYKSISFGFAGGNYANSQNIGTGEGCDRISNTQYFKQKYFMAGGGFSINKDIPSLNEQISYGLNAYLGSHTERNLNYTDEKSSLLFGFSPYATYDSKWVGLGGGFHIGNLSYTINNTRVDGTGIAQTGTVNKTIFPLLYARLGVKKTLFLEYQLANNFPTPFPGIREKIGIGSGFGYDNGFNIQVGSTISGSYLSMYLPVKNKFIIKPLIVWNDRVENEKSNSQFSLGMSYLFDHKSKMTKKAVNQGVVKQNK